MNIQTRYDISDRVITIQQGLPRWCTVVSLVVEGNTKSGPHIRYCLNAGDQYFYDIAEKAIYSSIKEFQEVCETALGETSND